MCTLLNAILVCGSDSKCDVNEVSRVVMQLKH